MQVLINTPLQRGVGEQEDPCNRFSGFSPGGFHVGRQTAEAVEGLFQRTSTPLKPERCSGLTTDYTDYTDCMEVYAVS